MSSIGSVYGEALYCLACEEESAQKIFQQLNILERCFREEPDFPRLLDNFGLSRAERLQILDDCFCGRVEKNLLNLLKLLTQKGYMRHFSACVDAFRALYNRDQGILPVTAVSAVSMTKEQMQKLTQTLEKRTKKRILLTAAVDSSVLGGMRLDFDGRRIDGTLSHRLDEMRNILKMPYSDI